MSEEILCPQCGSADTVFSKKRQLWVCEECEYSFVEEKSITPLRIFISYGRDEYADLALRLKQDLKARGHQVWFDEERLKEGGDWEQYIDEGLNWVSSDPETGRVVFVMTPHSVRRPDGYCLNEIAKALTRTTSVTPIMVVYTEPPLSIYRYQYLDMRDCYPPDEKNAIYIQRFERLLLALENKKIDFEGSQHKLLSALKPIEFSKDIAKLLHGFTGRRWVFDEVETWLHDQNGSKIFWLQGGPGVGKSAISAWLRDHYREISAFHFCDVNSEEKRDPRKLVASLVYQLSTQLPDYQERLAGLDVAGIMAEYAEAYTLFDKLVVQPLAEEFTPPDRTIVVLIDALDEATKDSRNEIAQFLSMSASKTPSWVRFLVTSRPEPEIAILFQTLAPFVLNTATAANSRDIEEYLMGRFPHITAEQTAAILDKSEGLFLYIRYISDEIQADRLSLDNLEEFPCGLGDVYTKFFMRQFGNNLQGYKDHIRPLLSLILAAHRPLELGFLRDVQGYKNRMELFDRIDTLGSLFPRSGDSDADTIVPFHKSLNDWLTAKDKSGPYYIDREYGHTLLADHGWAQYTQAPEIMADYHLEWLPQHLFTLNRNGQIVALLKDFRYLMQRTKQGYIHRLQRDYRNIVRNLPKEQKEQLRIEQSFFRTQGHILRRGDDDWPAYKILLQLAIEHADDSPLTIGAEQYLVDGRCDWVWLRRELRVKHAGIDPCVAVFEGHNGSVVGAYLLSNEQALSWSGDHTLRLWDLESGECLKVFKGHTECVRGVQLLESNRALSWSWDYESKDFSLRLWDLESGECLRCLEGHTSDVNGVHCLEDKRALSYSDDQTLRLWDLESGECLKVFKGHTERVRGVQLLENNRVLSWSWEHKIRLWDLKSGECLKELEGHVDSVAGLQLLEVNRALSWCGCYECNDSTLRLWDLESGKCLMVLESHTREINGVQILDGNRFLSWSDDMTLRLWNLESGDCLKVFEGHTGSVRGVHLLDGNRFLSWSNDMTLRLWNLKSGVCLAVMSGHTRWASSAILLSENRILSWSEDETLRIWNYNGEELLVLKGHTGKIGGVHLLPNNKVLSWSSDGTLRSWDINSKSQSCLECHDGPIKEVRVLNNANIMTYCAYSKREDYALKLWNKNGEQIAVLDGHTDWIEGALQFKNNNILSWSRDGNLRLWSLSGKALKTIEGLYGEDILGAFELNDHKIISWSGGGIYLWDSDGANIADIEVHDGAHINCYQLGDGRILSWGETGPTDDFALHIWSDMGRAIGLLKGHTSWVTGVKQISGDKILSWSKDGSLRLWSKNGESLAVLKGHTGWVNGVFLLEVNRALSWSQDKTLRLWDLGSGECLKVFEGHISKLNGANLIEGNRALSWSVDGNICLWNLENGRRLNVYNRNKIFSAPAVVWSAFLGNEKVLPNAGIDASGNMAILGYRHDNQMITIEWHGESECTAQLIFDDGRVIVTQNNGQVCFLRLYHGNQYESLVDLGK